MEAACAMALAMNVYSSRFVANVLSQKLEGGSGATNETVSPTVAHHDNVRGRGYYN